jgi:hypothetical protein
VGRLGGAGAGEGARPTGGAAGALAAAELDRHSGAELDGRRVRACQRAVRASASRRRAEVSSDPRGTLPAAPPGCARGGRALLSDMGTRRHSAQSGGVWTWRWGVFV